MLWLFKYIVCCIHLGLGLGLGLGLVLGLGLGLGLGLRRGALASPSRGSGGLARGFGVCAVASPSRRRGCPGPVVEPGRSDAASRSPC